MKLLNAVLYSATWVTLQSVKLQQRLYDDVNNVDVSCHLLAYVRKSQSITWKSYISDHHGHCYSQVEPM